MADIPGPGGNQTANGDPPSISLNATDLIWNFFISHSLNCNLSSINEETTSKEIKIYPNSTSNFINVILPQENKNFNIIIYNSTGEICFKEKIYDNIDIKISINKLSKGIYLLTVFDENGAITTCSKQ